MASVSEGLINDSGFTQVTEETSKYIRCTKNIFFVLSRIMQDEELSLISKFKYEYFCCQSYFYTFNTF